MKIQRKRYAVVRNNRTEILVGLAQNYHFKKVDDIGDTPIKTYMTEARAKIVCGNWSQRLLGDYEIIPVIETLESED